MSNLRDVERMARTFVAQKLEPDYIRHYLQESYQVDNETIDLVFEKIGILKKNWVNGKVAKKAPDRKPFN
jgi:hypothetical protein